MNTVDTLYGWTQLQWSVAQAYYNLCHKEGPKVYLPSIRSFMARYFADQPDPFDEFMDVMDWWQAHRTDSPSESPIIQVEIYRARSTRA